MKEFRSRRLRVWENINRTMQEFKVLLLGYRSYTALLTQSGTDAPVATVLENTLGDIVWSRINSGQYECTLTNGFIEDKTGILTTATFDGYVEAYWNNINTCQMITFNTSGTYTDSLLYKQLVEIRVYN